MRTRGNRLMVRKQRKLQDRRRERERGKRAKEQAGRQVRAAEFVSNDLLPTKP